MDCERYEDWVRVSLNWIRNPDTDLGLPHHIQTLGIEDAEIRGIRKRDIFDSNGEPLQDEYGILWLERWQIRAHLWVLGAYEVIRMLSERVRNDPGLTVPEAVDYIHKTKRLFERVRIPIAKYEASKRHSKTDFAVAPLGMGPNGLGWKVAEDTVVYQNYLSDEFFLMMTKIRPALEQNQQINQGQG
ncbi:MAG: hypothetical protein PsegKO_31030 [Pseudohongiellaceae bacterium]